VQSQRDFFYAVLSQGGLPCLAWLVPPAGDRKPYFKHKIFNTLEEFCEHVSDLDFTQFNYYFAVSTLRAPSHLDSTGTKRVRVQDNMLLTRCLILDVDLKDGQYADLDAVVNAVNDLSDGLRAPRPIIVDSGYGAHVYWPFAEGIDSKEWTQLARSFKKYVSIMQPGLVADASRVSDSASVLRIPDSFNLKKGLQKPVTIVQWMTGLTDVGGIRIAIGGDKPESTGKKVSLVIQQDVGPPASMPVVAKNCNWFAEYLRNRATASEPEWFATLGLVPYMEYEKDEDTYSGDRLAQLISYSHAGYDPDDTTRKFNQVVANQSGPTTCERFRGIKGAPCEQCPFATTVTTPIQTARLARPAQEVETKVANVIDDSGNVTPEEVSIPLYPAPYFRGEDGGVYVRVKEKQDDGTWNESIERVYDYDLYPVKRYRTEIVESEIMEVHVWLPHDGLRKFKLPTGLLAEQKKLAIFLAEKGVISEHGKSMRLARYMVDYIRWMQTQEAAEVEYSRFGWRDLKSPNPRFVVGNGFIDKDGKLQPASYAHYLKDPAKAVAQVGDYDLWRKGFNVYNSVPDSEAYILSSMLGFAAPLMAFTEYAGVLYNMVGESAAGKSTALSIMTSVWGQPKPQHVLISDNVIPMYNFIGYLNAIPVAMDELTNMSPERLSDFALAFTGGRGKMRANRDGTNQINSIEWDTIVAGTSNTSLYEKLAANRKGYSAEAMRIYEVNVPESHIEYKQVVDDAMRLIKKNYGHAGRVYISYIIQNVEAIQTLLDDTIRKITVRGNLRNEERFWGALFACVCVGGAISGKKLGLHDYDMNKLMDWALGKSTTVRETVRTSMTDPVSIMSNFFNSNINSILKFKDNKPHIGGDGRSLSYINSVMVRMEMSPEDVIHTAWVSTPAVRKFCEANRIDAAWLQRELVNMGILREMNVNKRLATGSGLPANSSIKCWNIDMQHPKMIEVSEAVAEAEPEIENGNA
jgi:hypothetical protein